MAQTKKRRRTKHRGNAAGMIEARGRTGRKPTGSERKVDAKTAAREKRLAKLDVPPTWRGALNRAAIAVVFFAVAIILIFKQPVAAALPLTFFMLIIYVPMSYYTDLMIYRRRQAKKKAGS
jgi:hypothetical protein